MLSILTYNVNGMTLKNSIKPLTSWVLSTKADVLCFQELFLQSRQIQVQSLLEQHGYTVYLPNEVPTVVGSGLLTAIRTNSSWKVRSSRFAPFLTYGYWDTFASKGSFGLDMHHTNGSCVRVVNTHMQSPPIGMRFFVNPIHVNTIRRNQASELVHTWGDSHHPVLIAGDFNENVPSHTRLIPLCCKTPSPTYLSTGEVLDHIVWIDGTCPKVPIVHSVNVIPPSIAPWSDHQPLLLNLVCSRT